MSRLRGLVLAVTVTLAVVSGSLSAAPASAAQYGLDQQGQIKVWCQRAVFRSDNMFISASPDNAFNPYTWRCRAGAVTRGIDMNAVCHMFHGGNFYAIATNPRWAWSWVCRN